MTSCSVLGVNYRERGKCALGIMNSCARDERIFEMDHGPGTSRRSTILFNDTHNLLTICVFYQEMDATMNN